MADNPVKNFQFTLAAANIALKNNANNEAVNMYTEVVSLYHRLHQEARLRSQSAQQNQSSSSEVEERATSSSSEQTKGAPPSPSASADKQAAPNGGSESKVPATLAPPAEDNNNASLPAVLRNCCLERIHYKMSSACRAAGLYSASNESLDSVSVAISSSSRSLVVVAHFVVHR